MRLFDMTASALQAWGQRLDMMQEMFRRNGALEQGRKAAVARCEMRAAMMTCLKCKDSEACESWLADEIQDDVPPAFCPNAQRIMHLRKEAGPRAA